MNKAIYAVVGIGAVCLAAVGASAWSGGAVTSRLSEQTAIARKLLPGLNIEERIDRGLFSTKRELKIRLGCAPKPGPDGSIARTQPVELRWLDVIHHGPFPGGNSLGAASIDSTLLTPDAWQKEVRQVVGDQPLIAAHTAIGFSGSFVSDVDLPKFKLAPKAGEEVAFSGVHVHMQGKFPMRAGTVSYTATTAPISFETKTAEGTVKVGVGATSMQGSAQIDPDAPTLLLPFQHQGSLDSMTMQAKLPSPSGGPATAFDLSITKAQAKGDSKVDKELWSTTSSLSGVLDINGFTIDKFELSSAMRRLHAPSYTKLLGKLIETSFSCDAAKSADPTALLDALAESSFALLPYDPEYEVGPLAIELAGKRAELSYMLGVRGVTPADASLPLVALLAQKSVARAEAKAHLGLIDEVAKLAGKLMASAQGQPAAALPQGMPDPTSVMARAMIDNFVTQGYLVRDGDYVRAKVESVAGGLVLNGKPLDMTNLFGGP